MIHPLPLHLLKELYNSGEFKWLQTASCKPSAVVYPFINLYEMGFFLSTKNRRWLGWTAAVRLQWANGNVLGSVTSFWGSRGWESQGERRRWSQLHFLKSCVTVQDVSIQKRTGCWCQELMWLCSVPLCKPFPGMFGMESFTGSLPSDSKSAQEWKIPTQTRTQAVSATLKYGNIF